MGTILSNFGLAAALSTLVLGVTGLATLATFLRARSLRRPVLKPTARIVAVGAACLILAATAAPYSWPPERYGLGDLVLEIGRGGLGELRQALASFGSLSSLLLIANVGLYVPLTFGAAIGWPKRGASILAAALLLSIAVETLQFLLLERVAATDDVILNVSGAAIGLMLGIVVRRSGGANPT